MCGIQYTRYILTKNLEHLESHSSCGTGAGSFMFTPMVLMLLPHHFNYFHTLILASNSCSLCSNPLLNTHSTRKTVHVSNKDKTLFGWFFNPLMYSRTTKKISAVRGKVNRKRAEYVLPNNKRELSIPHQMYLIPQLLQLIENVT